MEEEMEMMMMKTTVRSVPDGSDNDEQASEAQKAQLLLDIKARQSPGVVRMLDALCTPAGRPVKYYWYRYIKCEHHHVAGGIITRIHHLLKVQEK